MRYYIYHCVHGYMSHASHDVNLLGTYDKAEPHVYYFACFTRSIDAADYCMALNRK